MGRKDDHWIRLHNETYQKLLTLQIVPPNASISDLVQKIVDVTEIILTQKQGNEDITQTAREAVQALKEKQHLKPLAPYTPSPV
jgi:hypothetical protein